MLQLIGTPQHYDWGDHDAIPRLLGIDPDGRPWAELWYGAHPSAPSRVVGDDRTLDQIIAADPEATLGAADRRGRDQLPFLVKILAAERALSIQTHPDLDQARAGFAREEAAGVPVDAPERIYRDANTKPELICALSDFHALVGLAPLERTRELVADLDHPGLAPLHETLDAPGAPATVLADALRRVLSDPAEGLVKAAVEALVAATDPRFDRQREIALTLARDFPGDPGAVVSLLLNPVTLERGQALSLRAGQLHAYLRGTGVEVMSNSDNVVRGALTSKHVDVDELLEIADCTPGEPVVQTATSDDSSFEAPEMSFATRVLDTVSEQAGATTVRGPAIVLALSDATEAGDLSLGPGEAVFVTAADDEVEIRNHGTAVAVSAA